LLDLDCFRLGLFFQVLIWLLTGFVSGFFLGFYGWIAALWVFVYSTELGLHGYDDIQSGSRLFEFAAVGRASSVRVPSNA
jgi:hypothetical protein